MVHAYDKRAGLYVHIPFCLKKCRYCDFYSTTDLSQSSRFLSALRKEMQLSRKIPLFFDTLYIGGGTPSMLAPIGIKQIIEWARMYFRFTADAEITIEVNPGTVTRESLGAYRDFGVNRLSIGVQSFDDANLRFLGRAHCAEDARLCVEWARGVGFDNLGLDLIFGLPGQDRSNWLGDLRAAVCFTAAKPPSTSVPGGLSMFNTTPRSVLRSQCIPSFEVDSPILSALDEAVSPVSTLSPLRIITCQNM